MVECILELIQTRKVIVNYTCEKFPVFTIAGLTLNANKNLTNSIPFSHLRVMTCLYTRVMKLVSLDKLLLSCYSYISS